MKSTYTVSFIGKFAGQALVWLRCLVMAIFALASFCAALLLPIASASVARKERSGFRDVARLLAFIVSLVFFTSAALAVVPGDMVAHYCFDDASNLGKDCSTYGNNGIPSGGVTAVAGVVGGGAKFGGSSNPGVIRVPNSASLKFGTTNSLSYFVKIDSSTRNKVFAVAAKSHDRKGFPWFTLIDSTNQLVSFFGGFAGVTMTKDTDVLIGWATAATGRWVHVVQVVDSVGFKVYMDGRLAWSQSGSADFGVTNTQDLYIGKFSDAYYPLDGTLDDLRIYNRALSATEVQSLYQVTTVTPSVSSFTPRSGTTGTTATVTVNGSNFPSTLIVNIDGQFPLCTRQSVSATQGVFSCPLSLAGIRTFEVKTNTDANGGRVIGSSTFTVNPAVTNTAPVVSNLVGFQSAAGQPLNISFNVYDAESSTLKLLRMHYGTSQTTYVCYQDLDLRIGGTSTTFNGMGSAENGGNCASLIPTSGSRTIWFKVEAVDPGNLAAAVQSGNVEYQVATVVDTTPDNFAFTAQTGVALNSVITSNPITVSGITPGASARIVVTGTGASFSVNGGSYGTTSLTLGNGDQVRVRLTSSASYATTSSALVGIGGVTATFSVTTRAATTQTLTVTGSGTGSGTVISGETSKHINCSITAGVAGTNSCSYNEAVNATVTLTAAPASGSTFTAWTAGACTNADANSTRSCKVTMDAAKTVGAGFALGVPIETAAQWIAPGEKTKILTVPRNSALSACTSSNTAVATVNDGEVTGVARGDANITCNGASTPIKVRRPWVTDISPKEAIVGVDTVFTITGQDINIGYLSFVLPNCIGDGVIPADFPIRPSLIWTANLETRQFVCIPTAKGKQIAQVHTVSNTSSNYADKRLSSPASSPALGGVDCALSNSCSVEFKPGGAITDKAAIAAVMDSAIPAALNVNGDILWWSLTEAQLNELTRRLTDADISMELPVEWFAARQNELAAQQFDYKEAIRAAVGKAGVEGYTWKDFWRPSMYTGWISTTYGAYSGKDWLQVAGGFVLNGSMAVIDASSFGTAYATKFGKGAATVTTKMFSLPVVTKLAKLAKKVESAKKLSMLLEGGTDVWNAWGDDEKLGLATVVAASKVIGADKLAQYLGGTTNIWDEQLAKITAKIITGTVINAAKDAYEESQATGQTISADEMTSIADVLTSAKDAAAKAAVAATPILGSWVDMGELSYKIADRAYGRYFEDTDRLTAEFSALDAATLHRYRVANLIRLYQTAHMTAGNDNLAMKPPVLTAGLPLAWLANGFASTVKTLVLVTHGWSSSAVGTGWPKEFTTLTCSRVGANVQTEIQDNNPHKTGIAQWCTSGDLLVASYNWTDEAEISYRDGSDNNPVWVRMPSNALANAQALGKNLGEAFRQSGLRPNFSHLIAHSAGSGLIEELAARLKTDNPAGVRHQTFLDSYCPNPGNCTYGANGTWAEQYVHIGNEPLINAVVGEIAGAPAGLYAAMYAKDATGVTLPNAYSFDVTQFFDAIRPDTGHAYPYNVYLKSAGSFTAPAVNLSELGVHLSREYGFLAPLSALGATYPVGTRCVIPKSNLATKGRASVNGECEVIARVNAPTRVVSAPTYQSIYSRCDTPLAPSPGALSASTCLTPVASQASARSSASALPASAIATSPSLGNTRIALQFTKAANTLSFNYQFVLAPAGTIAQVFIDDRLVFVAASDLAGMQVNQAKNVGFATIEPGEHYLQVVLTSGSSALATLNLTNISYELVKTDAVELTTPLNLGVDIAGSGSGSVVSSPYGISCGSTCSALFNTGASVTLTATPATGSSFTGWDGACIGTGTCMVTMVAARNVTASFSASTIAPGCTLSASPASVTPGASSTLTVSCSPAATAYVWTGGTCAGTSAATCSVTPTVTTTYTVAGSNAGGTGAAASATVAVTGTPPVVSAKTYIDNGDGTVTDPTTGLTWMRCAMGQRWTGSTCTGTAGSYTWDQANALTGRFNFAGQGDWRLPNIRELQTVVDRSMYGPAIDSGAFPNTPSSYFWSGSSNAPPDLEGVVNFYNGYPFADNEPYSFYVRLVRSGQSFGFLDMARPNVDYVDRGNGTVTHSPTGLTWQRCAVGQSWTGNTCSGIASTFTWDAAKLLTSSVAGQTDWRLPTVEELVSLVDYTQNSPAINTTQFPVTPGSSGWWSDSLYAPYPDMVWFVGFGVGGTYLDNKTSSYYARLVRSGQSLGPLIFPGNRANYRIVKTSTGFNVVDNRTGITTALKAATAIKFADITVNLLIGDLSKTIAASDLKTLIELYVAFFNRVPEADGLAYWITQFKTGMTLDQIADSFYAAAISFTSLTGYSSNMSAADFVWIIFKNVLGRSGINAPPAADVAYWAYQLETGMSKGQLVSIMLASAHTFAGDVLWGWVPQLLDNKVRAATLFTIKQGLNYNAPEESISKGMAIAAAVTKDGIEDAVRLMNLTDTTLDLTLP